VTSEARTMKQSMVGVLMVACALVGSAVTAMLMESATVPESASALLTRLDDLTAAVEREVTQLKALREGMHSVSMPQPSESAIRTNASTTDHDIEVAVERMTELEARLRTLVVVASESNPAHAVAVAQPTKWPEVDRLRDETARLQINMLPVNDVLDRLGAPESWEVTVDRLRLIYRKAGDYCLVIDIKEGFVVGSVVGKG